MRRGHGSENLCRLRAGGRVTRHFVFKNEDDSLLAELVRSLGEFSVDSLAIRGLIFEPPKIKTANPIGLEFFRQCSAFLEYLILIFVCIVRLELIALRTELG